MNLITKHHKPSLTRQGTDLEGLRAVKLEEMRSLEWCTKFAHWLHEANEHGYPAYLQHPDYYARNTVTKQVIFS